MSADRDTSTTRQEQMASGCRGIPPQVTRTYHARGLGGSPN
jgi:hypothetical protein